MSLRVYVYETFAFTKFMKQSNDVLTSTAFGHRMFESEYWHAQQYSVSFAFMYRLYTSKYLTRNWEEADLFVIPLLPQGRPYDNNEFFARGMEYSDKGFELWPKKMTIEIEPLCKTIWQTHLNETFIYLTPATARRHVLITVGFTDAISMCLHVQHRLNISGNPRSSALLGQMSTITLENYNPSPKTYWSSITWSDLHGISSFNVPFMSGIRSARAYSNMYGHPRPFFLSFAGSKNGNTVGMALRKQIVDLCVSYGEPLCKHHVAANMEHYEHLLNAFEIKQKSVFCLEPGGFTDVRSAMFDALAMGCIPVLFLSKYFIERGLPLVAPFHWGPILHNTSVIIDANEFLNKRIDLLDTLQSISMVRIEKMQAILKAHISRLTWHGIGENYTDIDAFDISLATFADFANRSHTMKHQSVPKEERFYNKQNSNPQLYRTKFLYISLPIVVTLSWCLILAIAIGKKCN